MGQGLAPNKPSVFRLATFGDLIDLHVIDMREVGKPPRRSKAAILAALKHDLGKEQIGYLDRQKLIDYGKMRAEQGAGPVTLGIDIGVAMRLHPDDTVAVIIQPAERGSNVTITGPGRPLVTTADENIAATTNYRSRLCSPARPLFATASSLAAPPRQSRKVLGFIRIIWSAFARVRTTARRNNTAKPRLSDQHSDCPRPAGARMNRNHDQAPCLPHVGDR